jgi:hypothetical protein
MLTSVDVVVVGSHFAMRSRLRLSIGAVPYKQEPDHPAKLIIFAVCFSEFIFLTIFLVSCNFWKVLYAGRLPAIYTRT